MAKERGWWKLECNVELSEVDREQIADLIRDGFREGEVAADPDHTPDQEE